MWAAWSVIEWIFVSLRTVKQQNKGLKSWDLSFLTVWSLNLAFYDQLRLSIGLNLDFYGQFRLNIVLFFCFIAPVVQQCKCLVCFYVCVCERESHTVPAVYCLPQFQLWQKKRKQETCFPLHSLSPPLSSFSPCKVIPGPSLFCWGRARGIETGRWTALDCWGISIERRRKRETEKEGG